MRETRERGKREKTGIECPFGRLLDFSLTGVNGLKGHKKQATNNAQTNNITLIRIFSHRVF